MSTSTPHTSGTYKRSASSKQTHLPSRPTTPLRPSSRSSLRESNRKASVIGTESAPLEAFEPAFAELSDSMADLEANFMHLQIMHESLSRFNENFSSFLYGLNMNAFCVDFPEAPIKESFQRARNQDGEYGRSSSAERYQSHDDAETTFMTTDTSFVEDPGSSRLTPKKPQTPTAPPSRIAGGPSSRGGIGRGGAGRGAGRGTRGSGLARARGRGGRGYGTT